MWREIIFPSNAHGLHFVSGIVVQSPRSGYLLGFESRIWQKQLVFLHICDLYVGEEIVLWLQKVSDDPQKKPI